MMLMLMLNETSGWLEWLFRRWLPSANCLSFYFQMDDKSCSYSRFIAAHKLCHARSACLSLAAHRRLRAAAGSCSFLPLLLALLLSLLLALLAARCFLRSARSSSAL